MKFGMISKLRRIRRVPCKLNNVTKRKHQTGVILVNHNQEVAKYAVKSITRNGNYKNEAMTNSSIKDLDSYGCLDTILLRV